MGITEKSTAERIQAWVPSSLAEALRAQADLERRSISHTVKLAIEDRLHQRSSGEADEPRRIPFHPPSGAGSEGDDR